MNTRDLQGEIDTHVALLRRLQTKSGLFLAAAEPGVSTGYDKSWLRDNFYEVMAFEEIGDMETAQKTWHALLDIFLKHEEKIQWAIKERPRFTYQYIHARYNPETFEEFWEEWGNKQHDAIGCILFAIGKNEQQGNSVIRSNDDRRILQRLVDYLGAIEYWRDPDNGVWEEYEEVHMSSVGACVAGLRMIGEVGLATVPDTYLTEGVQALAKHLPRESHTKFTDLALLSLIYPYAVVTDVQADLILHNLTYHLERDKGVIRYKNDRYYNANEDGYSEEAEWTMGFPWLSIIYRERGDHERANYWLDKARAACDSDGKLPELYYSHTNEPNENNPLGWAESLYVIALHKLLTSART
jgi:GH15 family glucan-1,4-alpha-glucosidase